MTGGEPNQRERLQQMSMHGYWTARVHVTGMASYSAVAAGGRDDRNDEQGTRVQFDQA
jgi:hypothetical protein